MTQCPVESSQDVEPHCGAGTPDNASSHSDASSQSNAGWPSDASSPSDANRPGGPNTLGYFDSHCHLDFEAFDADRAEVWQHAVACGVTGVFVPGVRAAQWAALRTLRARIPELLFGVGLHPYFLHERDVEQRTACLNGLARVATELGAAAIGECGLDARVSKRGGLGLDEQEAVLGRQLDIAQELRLPVVLHVVGAHGRALQLLERRGPLHAGGALHAYSGSAELVPRYAALGLRFGFGGAVTQPRARRCRAALAAVPLDLLLLETDAPDQPPFGFAGPNSAPPPDADVADLAARKARTAAQGPAAPEKVTGRVRNEPAALRLVANAICEQLKLSDAELARITTNNALALFGGPSVC